VRLKWAANSRAEFCSATGGRTALTTTTNCTAVASVAAASVARYRRPSQKNRGTSEQTAAVSVTNHTGRENAKPSSDCATSRAIGNTAGPAMHEGMSVRAANFRAAGLSEPSISRPHATAARIATAGKSGQM